MLLVSGQKVLVAAAGFFFALQLLPHHITRLHNSPFAFVYSMLTLLFGLVIIVGGAITFLMWITTRDGVSKRRHRNWFATFALMFTAAIVFSLCDVAYARGLPTGSFVRQFDRNTWWTPSSSQWAGGDITERQKMLGDVIRRLVIHGTQESIIASLGPSEDPEYFLSSGRDLIYRTGPERDSLLAIDSEWLLIWFDSRGRTSRYAVWSD